MNDLKTTVTVVKELNQSFLAAILLPKILAAKQLQGMSCAGDEVESFEAILQLASKTDDYMCRALTMTTQIELSVINQDLNDALNLLEGAGNLRQAFPGYFASVRITVLEALVYLEAAQASKSLIVKMKHKKRAMKSMKMVRGWAKGGNANVVHMLHLLEAEKAMLKGNELAAEEQFKMAISVAARNGFLQDKGLTHEFAGRYYEAKGDDYWARYHLEQAANAFSDWGAIAKVEQLREQSGALLGNAK